MISSFGQIMSHKHNTISTCEMFCNIYVSRVDSLTWDNAATHTTCFLTTTMIIRLLVLSETNFEFTWGKMNLRIVNRTYFQNLKIKIVTNNTPLVDGCCSTYGVDKSRLRMVDVRTLVLTLRISTETFYRHRNMDLRVSEKCVQCSLDLKPKTI